MKAHEDLLSIQHIPWPLFPTDDPLIEAATTSYAPPFPHIV